MWRLTAYGRTRRGIPGIPWRDMTDEEFARAEALLSVQFPDQPGVLREHGYFVHVELEPKTPTRRRLRPAVSAAPATGEEITDA